MLHLSHRLFPDTQVRLGHEHVQQVLLLYSNSDLCIPEVKALDASPVAFQLLDKTITLSLYWSHF